jgi:hypothetical protein
MRDAQHLRAQAELCLKIARQMSDPRAAEDLQAEAAHHCAEADAIEAGEQLGSRETSERR